MTGVVKKVRSVSSTKHLRTLIEKCLGRSRITAENSSLPHDSDSVGVVALGPAFSGYDPSRLKLGRLYDHWLNQAAGLETKTYHLVFTHPRPNQLIPTGSFSRYGVACALATLRAFQEWLHPGAALSTLAGFHEDPEYPHTQLLVMPKDSLGRSVNFSRLTPLRTSSGLVRVDCQRFLNQAYEDHMEHFAAPGELFKNNPQLATITPKLRVDDWYSAVCETFNAPEATSLSTEGLLARFEASKRDIQSRFKAADEIRTEVNGIRNGMPDIETRREFADGIATQVGDSRSARDAVIADAASYKLGLPRKSGHQFRLL